MGVKIFTQELLTSLDNNLGTDYPSEIASAEESVDFWNGRVTLGKDFVWK